MTTFLIGDALDCLRKLPDESVDCCVTSPPYWNLRDYGVSGQIGLEADPFEFIDRLVVVFREVRRILKSEGTCWVNIGDTYCQSGGRGEQGETGDRADRRHTATRGGGFPVFPAWLHPKEMMGIPWRLAFAMQADGWRLRQEIIWHKPNPMPESAQDRCTKAHEPIFLFSKSRMYYWDHRAMREPVTGRAHRRMAIPPPAGWGQGSQPRDAKRLQTPEHHRKIAKPGQKIRQNESFQGSIGDLVDDRNRRSVWTVQPEPCREAHFATFPTALVKPIVKTCCPQGGTIIDPFCGTGTVGLVAQDLARSAILIDINPQYLEFARQRIARATPGLPLE